MNLRPVHPGAWFAWAAGTAAAATRTTNLAVQLLLAAVVLAVVAGCAPEGPLPRAQRVLVKVALWVVGIRLVLQVLFAPRIPGRVLFTLPSPGLPSWAGGLSVGGAVTAEALVAGVVSAGRLAVVLLCVGAVNSVTSPARLLRSLPDVLYETGVAATVAVSTTPQAIVAAARLRDARRLRGRPTRGPSAVRGTAVPVLDGALARSLTLAASMDARGFGRTSPARARRAWLAAGGTVLLALGAASVLGPGAAPPVSIAAAALGATLAVIALLPARHAGHVGRTRHRPLAWDGRATAVLTAGVAPFAATLVVGATQPGALHPAVSPLAVPPLPPAITAGLVLALTPLLLAPRAVDAP